MNNEPICCNNDCNQGRDCPNRKTYHLMDAFTKLNLGFFKDKEMNNEPVAWMPIIGFEGQYEVSDAGDIRNVKSGRILAKSFMGAGYVKADLWSFGKRWQTSVHRIVAGAFLGIPIEDMEVNHKDGDKTNNHVSNLEWVTKSENEKHSREELGNLCKPVKAICLKTGEVRIYPSQTATARDGFEPKCVSDICRKEDRYTHKGWAFEYYTHPIKELTDDEIVDIGTEFLAPKDCDIYTFARAILRKASE